MDGDVFGTRKSEVGLGDMSAPAGMLNPVVFGTCAFDNWRHQETRASTPVYGLCLRWITASAAVLGTIAAAWAGHFFLSPAQFPDQAMPDAMALLIFFLVSKRG